MERVSAWFLEPQTSIGPGRGRTTFANPSRDMVSPLVSRSTSEILRPRLETGDKVQASVVSVPAPLAGFCMRRVGVVRVGGENLVDLGCLVCRLA